MFQKFRVVEYLVDFVLGEQIHSRNPFYIKKADHCVHELWFWHLPFFSVGDWTFLLEILMGHTESPKSHHLFLVFTSSLHLPSMSLTGLSRFIVSSLFAWYWNFQYRLAQSFLVRSLVKICLFLFSCPALFWAVSQWSFLAIAVTFFRLESFLEVFIWWCMKYY